MALLPLAMLLLMLLLLPAGFSASSLILRADSEASFHRYNESSTRTRTRTRMQQRTALNFCQHCVCGVNGQTRIVNGEISSTSEFPWAVGLNYHGDHHCGASLLTRKHLLTAAHCIDGFQQRYFTARLADELEYPIGSLKIHESYDKRSFDNDIAIVELATPLEPTALSPAGGPLKAACLPSTSTFHYDGATAVAIGWGRTGEGKPVSEQLRKVDLPIMSKEQCQLLSGYPENRLTDNMFCAGYLQGERDSCHGDSGGALHVRNADGAMEVVGLVSFGRGCARPKFPGVYTKISNYLAWIGKHLNNECLCSVPARRLTSSTDRSNDLLC